MINKYDQFSDIPKNITLETLAEWRYEYTLVLRTSPWLIEDDSILDMQNIDDPSIGFRLWSSTLSKHLVAKLIKSGFTSMIKEYKYLIEKGHGVTLFHTLFDDLLPQSTNKILNYNAGLGNLYQKSGGSANDFKIRSSRIWDQMETLGYDNLGDIRRAFLQNGILEGAYKTKRCVETLDEKLIHGDMKLDDYTEESFTKHMTAMFTNSNVYENGKMKYMNGGKAVGCGRVAMTRNETSSDLQTRMDGAFGLVSSGNRTSPVTAFDIINMFRMTHCLACRYAKNDKCSHHMQRCTVLKEFGLNFTYTPETDIHCPKIAKHHKEKAKKAEKQKKEKKANEETPSAASNLTTINTNSIPTTSAQTGRDAANPFTTIGKGGSKTTSEAESKQAEANNLACQAKARQDEANALVEAEENEKPTGSVCKASTRRGFNFEGDGGDGDGGVFQFVDSPTASNDFKNDVDEYLHPIYNELEKLNRVDRHGVTQQCIGTCRKAGRLSMDDQPAKNQKASIQTNKHYKGKLCKLCPDSGASSHMFTEEGDFDDDYRRCKNVFVYMGDSTRVPVIEYGTARIKLNGKVQVLPKSLHVPGLDCSLLSITRHGQRKGCTFFTGDSKWHLTFPRFSIEALLPDNGDLQIEMEQLTSEDWLSADFTYGVDNNDTDHADHLDVFARRLKALNQIHRGCAVTRAQSKKQLDRLTFPPSEHYQK